MWEGEIMVDKKWGRPKGSKQSDETKAKISKGVKEAYLKTIGDKLWVIVLVWLSIVSPKVWMLLKWVSKKWRSLGRRILNLTLVLKEIRLSLVLLM